MLWVWVVVGLVLWTCAALVVIALCTSVRQIDGRLGRGRQGTRVAMEPEPQPGTGLEVE